MAPAPAEELPAQPAAASAATATAASAGASLLLFKMRILSLIGRLRPLLLR
jgi:hypothetical protein